MGAFSTVVASRHLVEEGSETQTFIQLYRITYNPTLINRAFRTDFSPEPENVNKLLISLLVGWGRNKEGRSVSAGIGHAVTLDDYLWLAATSVEHYPIMRASLTALGVTVRQERVEVFPVMEWTNDWYEVADKVLGKS